MDYRHRQSASNSLAEFYGLGLHTIASVETVHATPTGKTTGQDGVTRTGSIITLPLGNIPSDSLWEPFHDIEEASTITEVAVPKRELRKRVHYHNLASPGSLDGCLQDRTQISNPNSKATPTLKKRRRPQTTQSPTADTTRRGQSKRSRSLLSNEAGGQLPKMSKSRQEPEQLERSVGLNRDGSLAADVASLAQAKQPIPEVAPEPVRKGIQSSLGREFSHAAEERVAEIENPSSKRNTNYHLRSTASGNLDGENEVEKKLRTLEGIPLEPEFSEPEAPKLSQFVEITDPGPVSIRMPDLKINTTHIVKLAGLSKQAIRGLRKESGSEAYEILRGTDGTKSHGTYVNFDIGIELSRRYGLSELEKRLDSLRSSSDLPISEAVSITCSQTSRRHSELPGSDSVSARNDSNRSKGTGSRDQPIADGPVQVDGAHDTDSDSDEASSGSSDTSPEPCSSRRNSQPVPPHCITTDPSPP
ncbi:MAG: hypothetical protein Q9172_006746 [Xanthocarpia lactea]